MRQLFLTAATFALIAAPAMACEWEHKTMTSIPADEEAVVMTPAPETPIVPSEHDVAAADTLVITN